MLAPLIEVGLRAFIFKLRDLDLLVASLIGKDVLSLLSAVAAPLAVVSLTGGRLVNLFEANFLTGVVDAFLFGKSC